MIHEFLKTYKDGGMVYLDPTERDRIVEEINRLKTINESHKRINGELREENNRLNNIINELEKDLVDRYYGRGRYSLSTDIIGIPTFLNRIKELKGEDKE